MKEVNKTEKKPKFWKRKVGILGKQIPVVGLLLVLVGGLGGATLLAYFGQITTRINVESPIDVEGDTEIDLSGMGGGEVKGVNLNIVNKADQEIDLEITSTEVEGVETSYVGTLILAEKVVVFGADRWELKEGGETATVEYTLVGDSFTAKVTAGAKEGYSLIYYKDNSNKYNNPAKAIKVEDVIGNLPYNTDRNTDEYNYCVTGEYDTCHGAKIWYVPTTAINGDDSLDWSKASEFLYETELIQYNNAGIITMYPESELGLYPLFDLDTMLNGTVVITTTIDLYEE